MTLIINLALFPNRWAELPPNHTTPALSTMCVDKVNIYQLKMDCNTPVYNISNFNTFNYGVKKSFILTNATVLPQNSNIILRATDFFELKNNFEVPLGVEFTLIPTPCY